VAPSRVRRSTCPRNTSPGQRPPPSPFGGPSDEGCRSSTPFPPFRCTSLVRFGSIWRRGCSFFRRQAPPPPRVSFLCRFSHLDPLPPFLSPVSCGLLVFLPSGRDFLRRLRFRPSGRNTPPSCPPASYFPQKGALNPMKNGSEIICSVKAPRSLYEVQPGRRPPRVLLGSLVKAGKGFQVQSLTHSGAFP